MATNYPASKDDGTSLPYPAAGNYTNSPSNAGIQDNQNDAIIAIQTKLGTGASTPTSGKFLTGTGVGTSSWANTVPTGNVVGTSDSQTLTNKTLTSPTINSPTISNATISADAITGYTSATNGTVYGVSITGGKIPTAGIANSAITTALINNAAVTVDKLSTGAAAAFVATQETTTSTTYANLATTTDTVTVTIGANGLALVSLYSYISNNTKDSFTYIGVDISGANTIVATDTCAIIFQAYSGNTSLSFGNSFVLTGLTAGLTTFKMKYRVQTGGGGAGTGSFANRRIAVIPL